MCSCLSCSGVVISSVVVEATKHVLAGETNLVVNIRSAIQKVNRTFIFCGCLLGNWG